LGGGEVFLGLGFGQDGGGEQGNRYCSFHPAKLEGGGGAGVTQKGKRIAGCGKIGGWADVLEKGRAFGGSD